MHIEYSDIEWTSYYFHFERWYKSLYKVTSLRLILYFQYTSSLHGDLNVLLNFVSFHLVEYPHSSGVTVSELWTADHEFEFAAFGFYLHLTELMFWKYNLSSKLNISFVYMRHLLLIHQAICHISVILLLIRNLISRCREPLCQQCLLI